MKNFVQPGKYGMPVISPAGGAISGQIVPYRGRHRRGRLHGGGGAAGRDCH